MLDHCDFSTNTNVNTSLNLSESGHSLTCESSYMQCCSDNTPYEINKIRSCFFLLRAIPGLCDFYHIYLKQFVLPCSLCTLCLYVFLSILFHILANYFSFYGCENQGLLVSKITNYYCGLYPNISVKWAFRVLKYFIIAVLGACLHSHFYFCVCVW